MSETGGRNPEIIRSNDVARRGQFCPHLRVLPGSRQVYRQQGEAFQQRFDKGRTPGPYIRLNGTVYPVE